MLFITGDTHGLSDVDKLHRFAGENPHLTKDDYMIIAGDFGAVWSELTLTEMLRFYSDLPFTVLFVDGNHENFDLLNAYPVTIWHGGSVHMVKPDVIHLMRGQIFEICGKTVFTFGGGTSIDRHMRREGISWWKEEIPSRAELETAIANLAQRGNTVDYIVTHSCDEKALYYPPLRSANKAMRALPDNLILNYFEENVTYRHWYFGHYHLDGALTDKKSVLYHTIETVV